LIYYNINDLLRNSFYSAILNYYRKKFINKKSVLVLETLEDENTSFVEILMTIIGIFTVPKWKKNI